MLFGTMKILNFTKPNVRDMAEVIEAEVNKIAIRYGLKAQYKGGSFSPHDCTLRLQLFIPQKDERSGLTLTPEGNAFKRGGQCSTGLHRMTLGVPSSVFILPTPGHCCNWCALPACF
jgi:hypothetical protein